VWQKGGTGRLQKRTVDRIGKCYNDREVLNQVSLHSVQFPKSHVFKLGELESFLGSPQVLTLLLKRP
jgi:hypothetical protein